MTTREELIKQLEPHGWVDKGDFWLFFHIRFLWKLFHWNFTEWEKQ